MANKTTLESLARLITRAASSADKKFTALAENIAAVEKRLDARLDKLDARIDNVESNLVAKIDRLGTKLTKFERSTRFGGARRARQRDLEGHEQCLADRRRRRVGDRHL
jgi:hypothetical protein